MTDVLVSSLALTDEEQLLRSKFAARHKTLGRLPRRIVRPTGCAASTGTSEASSSSLHDVRNGLETLRQGQQRLERLIEGFHKGQDSSIRSQQQNVRQKQQSDEITSSHLDSYIPPAGIDYDLIDNEAVLKEKQRIKAAKEEILREKVNHLRYDLESEVTRARERDLQASEELLDAAIDNFLLPKTSPLDPYLQATQVDKYWATEATAPKPSMASSARAVREHAISESFEPIKESLRESQRRRQELDETCERAFSHQACMDPLVFVNVLSSDDRNEECKATRRIRRLVEGRIKTLEHQQSSGKDAMASLLEFKESLKSKQESKKVPVGMKPRHTCGRTPRFPIALIHPPPRVAVHHHPLPHQHVAYSHCPPPHHHKRSVRKTHQHKRVHTRRQPLEDTPPASPVRLPPASPPKPPPTESVIATTQTEPEKGTASIQVNIDPPKPRSPPRPPPITISSPERQPPNPSNWIENELVAMMLMHSRNPPVAEPPSPPKPPPQPPLDPNAVAGLVEDALASRIADAMKQHSPPRRTPSPTPPEPPYKPSPRTVGIQAIVTPEKTPQSDAWVATDTPDKIQLVDRGNDADLKPSVADFGGSVSFHADTKDISVAAMSPVQTNDMSAGAMTPVGTRSTAMSPLFKVTTVETATSPKTRTPSPVESSTIKSPTPKSPEPSPKAPTPQPPSPSTVSETSLEPPPRQPIDDDDISEGEYLLVSDGEFIPPLMSKPQQGVELRSPSHPLHHQQPLQRGATSPSSLLHSQQPTKGFSQASQSQQQPPRFAKSSRPLGASRLIQVSSSLDSYSEGEIPRATKVLDTSRDHLQRPVPLDSRSMLPTDSSTSEGEQPNVRQWHPPISPSSHDLQRPQHYGFPIQTQAGPQEFQVEESPVRNFDYLLSLASSDEVLSGLYHQRAMQARPHYDPPSHAYSSNVHIPEGHAVSAHPQTPRQVGIPTNQYSPGEAVDDPSRVGAIVGTSVVYSGSEGEILP